MRRLIALAMVAGLGWPVSIPVVEAQATGSIDGTASNADQTPLQNYTVRLRNADTGQLVDTTATNAAGEYSFTGLNPANYVVEVVDAAGNVLIVSPTIPLAAGATISGVALTAAAAGGLGAFFTSTGGLALLAGVGAGITFAAVQAQGTASGSQ